MKKLSSKLLLNISVLALSICAIVVGIYSAKKANVIIGGTILYVANDCTVEISGSYSAYTSTNKETRTTTNIDEMAVGGKTQTEATKTKTLNQVLYFSDAATDGYGNEIEFTFTITNKSNFKIEVNAPAPTFTTTSTAKVSCISSNKFFTLEKDADATISFKYILNTDSAIITPSATTFNIALNFSKWTKNSISEQMYTSTITELFTDYTGDTSADATWIESTTQKLCTTMGHSVIGATSTTTGTDGTIVRPIQWYAFAVKGVDTGKGYVYNNTWYDNNTSNGNLSDRWYSLNGINFNDNLEMELASGNVSAKGQTFWFIQQYVTAGSYYMSTGSTRTDGVQFDSTNNYYASSSIYTYLADSEAETNYLSKTEIYNEELYSNVTIRDVNESYSINFTADYVTNGIYSSTFSSRLWLISVAELGLITNKDTTLNTIGYAYGTKIPGIGNQSLNNGASWWLRSPAYGNIAYARAITGDGRVDGYYMLDYYGIRSAFQISIPA